MINRTKISTYPSAETFRLEKACRGCRQLDGDITAHAISAQTAVIGNDVPVIHDKLGSFFASPTGMIK